MSFSIPCTLAGALLGTALLLSGRCVDDDRPSKDEIAEAAAMFQKTCSMCHVPPDLSFEVDRAWIHQVADTA